MFGLLVMIVAAALLIYAIGTGRQKLRRRSMIGFGVGATIAVLAIAFPPYTPEPMTDEEREAYQAQRAAEARAAAEAERVYYVLDTTCPSGADVTFFNEDGNISQRAGVRDGWRYGFIPAGGQYLSMSAQNQCGSGSVTVRIVKDGVTIQRNRSVGGYTIADVAGFW